MIHFTNTDNPIDFPKQDTNQYDFDSLDLVIRKWATQTQFEQDLENYEILKKQYE